MSKYLTFPEAQFKDRELLIKSLIALGWNESQIEVHDTTKPAHLYGYAGDMRKETAEVIIRRQHIGGSSNDLGFARNDTGALVPIVSEYDNQRFQHRFGAQGIVPKLRATYSEEVARKMASKLRGKMTVRQEGRVRKIQISY